MLVHFSLVGHHDKTELLSIKKDLPAVPQENDIVRWPDDVGEVYVRTVVWSLADDDEETLLEEPYAYVVCGRRRTQVTSEPTVLQRYLGRAPQSPTNVEREVTAAEMEKWRETTGRTMAAFDRILYTWRRLGLVDEDRYRNNAEYHAEIYRLAQAAAEGALHDPDS